MTDIATLGIAIDSRPTVTATEALKQLATAAAPAEQAVNKLKSTSTVAATSLADLSRKAKAAAAETETAFANNLRKAFYTGPLADYGRALDDVRAKYSPLYAAAREYTNALTEINQASRVGALSEQERTRAVNTARDAYVRQISTIKQAANQTGLARHELINLSRQAQDIGVSLASGQSPFLVLIQQGTQVGDIFASSRGSVSGFFSQVFSALTPTRLLTGAIGLAAAGAVAAVVSWKNYALALDEVSRATGETASEISRLQSAAAGKGVGSDDFAAGAKQFAAEVYRAKNGVGDLATMLRANGEAAGGFSTTLERVADLVQRTADYQGKLNILQKAGLPTSAAFVRFMDGGAAAIRQAKDAASEFGGIANDEMVQTAREFQEAWDSAWNSFAVSMRRTVTEGYGLLQKLILQGREAVAAFDKATGGAGESTIGKNLLQYGLGTPLSQNVNDLYGNFFPDGKKTTKDIDLMQAQVAQAQRLIGALGALATAEQIRAAKLQELNLLQAQGVNLTDTQKQAILDYTEAQANGTLAIRQQVEAAKVEIATIGMSVGEAAAFRAEQDKIIEARLRGIPLTEENIRKLKEEASVLGALTQIAAQRRLTDDLNFERSQLGRSDLEQQVATQMRATWGSEYAAHMNDATASQIRFNETLKVTKTAGEDALASVIQDLRDGKSATEAFSKVLVNLENQLIKLAANKIMSAAIDSGGSFLSGLFHGGFGPGDPIRVRSVDPSIFKGAPRFHSGIGPGERAAVIRTDESVLTPGQMRALGKAVASGTARGNVSVTINNAPAGTDAKVSQSQDENGGVRIDVWLQRHVDDTSAAMIDSGQSALNTSLERRYGLVPKL